MHRVRVRVPVSAASILKHEPRLISLAVDGLYDRAIDTMKFAARKERGVERGKTEDAGSEREGRVCGGGAGDEDSVWVGDDVSAAEARRGGRERELLGGV